MLILPTPEERLQLTTCGITNETAQQTATTTGATTASCCDRATRVVLGAIRRIRTRRRRTRRRRLRKSLIVLMQFWVPNVYDMVLFLVGPFGLLGGQF